MYIDRLITLARAVRAAPDETIDLDTWQCGTCFCALGLAASLGIGGLRLVSEGDGLAAVSLPVTRNGLFAIRAAAEVFGTEWLFGPRDDEGPFQDAATDRQVWLSRCRNLMYQRGKTHY